MRGLTRRRLAWISLTCAVVMLAASAARAESAWFKLDDPEDYLIRVTPRVWWANNDQFKLEVEDDVVPGALTAVIEWDADLDTETRVMPFVELKWKRHKLRAELFTLNQEELINTADLRVSVNGIPISEIGVSGAFGLGQIKLDMYQIGYQYDLWDFYGGYIAPLIDIGVVDYDLRAQFSVDTTGDGVANLTGTLTDEDTYPIPQVGLTTRFYPDPRVAVYLEGKGMTIGRTGTLVQALAALELQVQQHFAFEVGCRYLYVTLDIKDWDLRYEDFGPYIGTVFRY